MHGPIEKSLEVYLAGAATPGEFHQHMAACPDCRQAVEKMSAQAQAIRTLRPPEGVEPKPGFYARVRESIEARQRNSMWSVFLQPGFSRRLAMASVALLVLLGLSMMSSDPLMELGPDSPEAILAQDDAPPIMVGFDQDMDREAVLVNLATFQESQSLE